MMNRFASVSQLEDWQRSGHLSYPRVTVKPTILHCLRATLHALAHQLVHLLGRLPRRAAVLLLVQRAAKDHRFKQQRRAFAERVVKPEEHGRNAHLANRLPGHRHRGSVLAHETVAFLHPLAPLHRIVAWNRRLASEYVFVAHVQSPWCVQQYCRVTVKPTILHDDSKVNH